MNAATNTRDHIYIRGRAIRHQVAVRDWACGICESRLKTIWHNNGTSATSGFRTVCAANPDHSQDYFIHDAALERRVHTEMLQAGNLQTAQRRLNMGLKDRDTAYGVPLRMRLSRIGRIRQGIMATSAKGKKYPKAVNYFIIDPSADGGAERDEVLDDVRDAITTHAPEQDLDKPTILPIVFLANNDDIIAPESYKLRKGRAGTVWCAGDGETIAWKLTDDFRVEIAQGCHTGTGEVVPCPGGRKDDRHPWCEGCVAELEINFAIMGYERTGIWMLRTSSMTFRDQFWTQIGLVRAMAAKGIVPGLVGVPFLLRRQIEPVLSPVGNGGSLATVEMPLTSIEIHPQWFQEVMRQNPRLHPASPPVAIAAPAEGNGPDWDSLSGSGGAYSPGNTTIDGATGEPDPEPENQPQTGTTAGTNSNGSNGNGNGKANGNGGTRPLDGPTARYVIRKKADWQAGTAADYSDALRLDSEPITAGQVGGVVGLISDALGSMDGDLVDQTRKEILAYLVTASSTMQLTKKEASAIITWLKADGDEWIINQYAQSEVAAVLNAAGVESGQLEMEM